MVAVERPVPQQVVTEGESGSEGQRAGGHAPNPRVLRGRTAGGIGARSGLRPMIACHEGELTGAMTRAGSGSAIFAPGLLDGRAALVTGGGTGLGKATALELARCGAAVTIVGRRTEVLEQAAGEIGAIAGPVDWLGGDVRTPADAHRLAATA